MYWDTTDFLYSKPDSLFYRDKNYFNAMTANGKKSFWSRGNAWVLGGLAQILAMMNKKHPDYPKYEELYLQMIHKIAPLQQEDGLWRPSLLDPDDIPVKETMVCLTRRLSCPRSKRGGRDWWNLSAMKASSVMSS